MANSDALTVSDAQPLAAPLSVGSDPGLGETYRVWAVDNQVYGPVALEVLAGWVHDGRVQRDNWIYYESSRQWRLARDVKALEGLFPAGEETAFLIKQASEVGGVAPEEFRQFPALVSLTNHDLAQIIKCGQLILAAPGEVVVQRHQPGDALFFVLSGRLRARIFVGGDDKTLGTIRKGEFLGEMAMFTQTPRSADVVAEETTRLFRLSAEAFRHMIQHTPDVAAPMLYAVASTMAGRIQEDNKRFQQQVAAEFVWR